MFNLIVKDPHGDRLSGPLWIGKQLFSCRPRSVALRLARFPSLSHSLSPCQAFSFSSHRSESPLGRFTLKAFALNRSALNSLRSLVERKTLPGLWPHLAMVCGLDVALLTPVNLLPHAWRLFWLP